MYAISPKFIDMTIETFKFNKEITIREIAVNDPNTIAWIEGGK
jgi:hypothetical protein